MFNVFNSVICGNARDVGKLQEAQTITRDLEALLSVAEISDEMTLQAAHMLYEHEFPAAEMQPLTHLCWLPPGVIPSDCRELLPRKGPPHTDDLVATDDLVKITLENQKLWKQSQVTNAIRLALREDLSAYKIYTEKLRHRVERNNLEEDVMRVCIIFGSAGTIMSSGAPLKSRMGMLSFVIGTALFVPRIVREMNNTVRSLIEDNLLTNPV